MSHNAPVEVAVLKTPLAGRWRWEILNPQKSYTSARMERLRGRFFGGTGRAYELPRRSLTFIRPSQTCPQHCRSELLPAPAVTKANFIHKISCGGFRQSERQKLPNGPPPSFAETREGVCCFCSSNEMPSDLFINYLFGTAPLCSVHFFFYLLWSHVAQ